MMIFFCCFINSRFAITRLDDAPLFVMEIKIGAGPIGEMFMNISEEVKIIL